jgi:hypothetical protein
MIGNLTSLNVYFGIAESIDFNWVYSDMNNDGVTGY